MWVHTHACRHADTHTQTRTARRLPGGKPAARGRHPGPQGHWNRDVRWAPRGPSHLRAHEQCSPTPAGTPSPLHGRPACDAGREQGPGPAPAHSPRPVTGSVTSGAHVPQGPQTGPRPPGPPRPTRTEVVRARTLRPCAQDSGVGAPTSQALPPSTSFRHLLPRRAGTHTGRRCHSPPARPAHTARGCERLRRRPGTRSRGPALRLGAMLTGWSPVPPQTHRRRGQCGAQNPGTPLPVPHAEPGLRPLAATSSPREWPQVLLETAGLP